MTVTVAENLDPPPAPTALTATLDGGAVVLTWTAPSVGTGQATVNGHQLEASADGSTGWVRLVWYADLTTTHTNSSLPGGTTRHYRVRATSSAGESPWSDTVSATTPPAVSWLRMVQPPGNGDTYRAGESILVTVYFEPQVVVTGTPELPLVLFSFLDGFTINHSRGASYVSVTPWARARPWASPTR